MAKDISKVLGFTNSRKALIDHIFSEDVTKRDTLTKGGRQRMSWINESGLYCLIFGSRLPSALKFKRWVTSEVLPALRRNGSYSMSPVKPCSWIDLRSCRCDPVKAGRQGIYSAAYFLSSFTDENLSEKRLISEFSSFCTNVARLDFKSSEARQAFLTAFVHMFRGDLMRLRKCADFLDVLEEDLNGVGHRIKAFYQA